MAKKNDLESEMGDKFEVPEWVPDRVRAVFVAGAVGATYLISKNIRKALQAPGNKDLELIITDVLEEFSKELQVAAEKITGEKYD